MVTSVADNDTFPASSSLDVGVEEFVALTSASAPPPPTPRSPGSAPTVAVLSSAEPSPSKGVARPLVGEPPSPAPAASWPTLGARLPANPFAYNVSQLAAPAPATTASSIVAIGFMQLPNSNRPEAQLPQLQKHMHSAQGHFGPYFEDGAGPHNVTARVGSSVTLNCRVGMLQDKTVSATIERVASEAPPTPNNAPRF